MKPKLLQLVESQAGYQAIVQLSEEVRILMVQGLAVPGVWAHPIMDWKHGKCTRLPNDVLFDNLLDYHMDLSAGVRELPPHYAVTNTQLVLLAQKLGLEQETVL